MTNSIEVRCFTNDVSLVESKLRAWNEVESFASVREKKTKQEDISTLIINCNASEAVPEVKNKLQSIPEILKESTDTQKKKVQKGKRQKGIDITAEIFAAISKETPVPTHLGNQKRRNLGEKHIKQTSDQAVSGNHGGRGGYGGRGAYGGRGSSEQRRNWEGRGKSRGGRAEGFRTSNRGMGAGSAGFDRSSYVQASVAYIDNVPFGITNTRLMDILSPFGRVIDVNRFENMTMVCYDNENSVRECIQALNGRKIEENIVTVSSGSARIPEDVLISLTS